MTIAPPNPPAIWARDENVGGSQGDPTLIVMHATVTSDNAGTARNIAKRWQTTVTKSSAHYLRDARECIQSVGDHRVAYHCGYNSGSVAYEMCDEQVGEASRWEDADSTAIIKGSARDVARLGLAYGIPLRRLTNAQLRYWADNGKQAKHGGIVSHKQMSEVFKKSTHTDPREFPWSKFMALVEAEKKALLAGDKIFVPSKSLYVHQILWNSKVTMDPKIARGELFEMIEDKNPMAVMLQECDWAVQHSDYRAWRGPEDKDNTTVLMVREDLKVIDHGIHHMTKSYTGPHGHPKAPRTFPWAKIQVGNKQPRVASIHMPAVRRSHPAWIEADTYLTKAMQPKDGIEPVIYGGDWNGTGTSLPGTQYGATIDHLRLVNAKGVSKVNLGYHGSDHQAKRMAVKI